MSLFDGLVSNALQIRTARYAAILGESPSRGARSPHLWNAVFKANGVDCEMLPFDCSVEALPELTRRLLGDARFIGGACAMPHKSVLVGLLPQVEAEARKIGAVNAMCRAGSDLLGLNTDGRAAVSVLEGLLQGELADLSVTLIGLGGAGRAVATFMAGAAQRVVLCSRNALEAQAVVRAIDRDNCAAVPWPPSRAVLSQTQVLVNCTSVGHEAIRKLGGGHSSLRALTPLARFSEPLVPGDLPAGDFFEHQQLVHEAEFTAHLGHARELLAAMPADGVVYDIVYQPPQTTLLRLAAERGLRTLNGTGMNIEQAVIAFMRAAPDVAPVDRVRALMQERASQL